VIQLFAWIKFYFSFQWPKSGFNGHIRTIFWKISVIYVDDCSQDSPDFWRSNFI